MGLYVIEGLESGDFAVLTKMHHATIDGAAGSILTTMMLDTEPDAPLAIPAALPAKRAGPIRSATCSCGRSTVSPAVRIERFACSSAWRSSSLKRRGCRAPRR